MNRSREVFGALMSPSLNRDHPDQRPELRWNVSSGGIYDPAGFPERYINFCDGEVTSLDDPDFSAGLVLTTDDLLLQANDAFIASKGELTGVDGLLRLKDKLLPLDFAPKNVLMVGSLAHTSFENLLYWLRINGNGNAHVTLIDRSPYVVNVVNEMIRRGILVWPGGIDTSVVEAKRYQPLKAYDLIVADIISPYNVDHYAYPAFYRRSQYSEYETVLSWMRKHLTNTGRLLERTLIWPKTITASVNRRDDITIEKRADLVLQSVPFPLEREAVIPYVEELFHRYEPDFFCGLGKYDKSCRPIKALTGDHAAKVIDRLHKRHFPVVKKVEVFDPHTNCTFISYGCGLS